MQSVQPQIDALIAAPAGRALLLIAARSGLDPAGIATPRKTLELAALALAEVSRWRIDRPAALSQLERADPHRLQSLARALLTGCSVVVRAAGTLEAGMAFARRGSSPCRTSRKPRRIAVVLGALCAEARQRVLHVDAYRRVERREHGAHGRHERFRGHVPARSNRMLAPRCGTGCARTRNRRPRGVARVVCPVPGTRRGRSNRSRLVGGGIRL
jgi:hypothetical protein